MFLRITFISVASATDLLMAEKVEIVLSLNTFFNKYALRFGTLIWRAILM